MVGTVLMRRVFAGRLHALVAGLPTAVAHRELAEKHAFKEVARFSQFELQRCVFMDRDKTQLQEALGHPQNL